MLPSGQESIVARFSKGQYVTLKGNVSGQIMGMWLLIIVLCLIKITMKISKFFKYALSAGAVTIFIVLTTATHTWLFIKIIF